MSYDRPAPIVTIHDRIHVVRDDLYPGGTKARFLPMLFEDTDEVVYASPAQGGAQASLAVVARALGKRATIFVARRRVLHPRTRQVLSLGAKVVQVDHGYLTVVQARARRYCETTGAKLAPFGIDMPEAVALLAQDARRCGVDPCEVWCAASSGTLARALAAAWPDAMHHAVQVGRTLTTKDVGKATIHVYPRPYDWAANDTATPFPADPHYERKAWEVCKVLHGSGPVLFWNVIGTAEDFLVCQ